MSADDPTATQPRLVVRRQTLQQRLDRQLDSTRKGRLLARLCSAVLEPAYYWLDLFGPDDHPSNAKIVATASITVGLAILVVLAGGMAARGTTPDEWYVILVLGVVGGAAGWDSLKAIVKMRGANGSRAPTEGTPPA